MRRFALAVLVVLASVSTPAAALPQSEPQHHPTPEPVPIRIGVPENTLQFLNFWVAEGAGYFEEAGLDAELVMPPMPGQMPQFLLQGQVDVTVLQPPLFLGMIGQEQPVQLFANLLTNDPINLVVDRDVSDDRDLSPADPLKDRLLAMQDLKVGAAENVVGRLQVLFQSVGLKADDIVDVVVLHGPDQIPALTSGAVDALYTHTPFMEQALIDHDALLLVNQSAGEVPALARLQIHAMVSTNSYIEDHPLAVLRVTRALYRAQQLIQRNPDAAVQAVLSSSVPNLVEARVETVVDIYRAAVLQTPLVSPHSLVRTADLFTGRPVHPDFTEIDPRDYIDNRFAWLAVLLGRR